MDARYVQRGDAVDYTPMADVAAGDVVALGTKFFGVAKLDIKAGELGALALTGVYEMTKAAGVAFALGSEVAWDRTNKKAVAPGTSGSAGPFSGAAPAISSGDPRPRRRGSPRSCARRTG